PTTAPLFLSWATGPSLDDAVGTPIPTGPNGATGHVQTAPGTYPLTVPAAQLGIPPAGANYLVVAADPPAAHHPHGLIQEPDEDNNVSSLELCNDLVLKDSVQTKVDGPKIQATFTPAQGALTLGQAAVLVGVQRFNWFQTVSYPQDFDVFQISIPEKYFYTQV